jgi:hypothetical protein
MRTQGKGGVVVLPASTSAIVSGPEHAEHWPPLLSNGIERSRAGPCRVKPRLLDEPTRDLASRGCPSYSYPRLLLLVFLTNSTRVWLGQLPLMVEARLALTSYRWVHYGYCPRRVEGSRPARPFSNQQCPAPAAPGPRDRLL